MRRLLLAPAAAALLAATPPASSATVRAAAPPPGCTDARTGAPVACPDLTEGGRPLWERFSPHHYCPPEGCAKAGPYDPVMARPAVLEWEDPYNPGANPRN
ncbi:hypothetical protein [Nonomuraea zeae]|uniref:Uncharacterized protein n=1 Tax=Nonomuraea zeae TaxID=1642303 RepID=A0A5S4GM32_9ACTN|nr:hypothetical protein [Nonomuraea zeae]TMR33977.1 hypothetical protein ETD85_18335 [Nonomuraea zeae]